MRAFVFLLILANLMFLAWTQGYFDSASDPDALRVQQQLLADRVRIVARDEAQAEAIKAERIGKPAAKKTSDVCLQLTEPSIADAERIESRLAEKLPAFKAQRTVIESRASYWVFIPPFANKREAENKAVELKKLGVPEFFIVQENGPKNWAISLGLFSSMEAATSRLEALRGKGVKSARIGEREGKPTLAALAISGPEAQVETLRQLVADTLPESKSTTCQAQLSPST
jgi:hypothetical protein